MQKKEKERSEKVRANCSGHLYCVLGQGQGGVNCWGALSICNECEYCLCVLQPMR